MERPRDKGHGDYSTNVAMQLAKKAGTNPRALGELLATRAAARPTASRRSTSPARVPQRHRRGRRPGPGRGRHRRRRRGVRHQRQPGRREGQRRVHLRQPDRPDPPRPHPLGGRRRRHRPGARGRRRVGDPRVLHQRPRQPDGPLRRLDRGPGARRAGARRRLPGRLRRRPRRRRSWPSSPSSCDLPPGEERTVAFREAGYALQLREQQEALARFHTVFDVWFSERSLHDGDVVAGAGEAARRRATSTTPTARSGCAPPTSATTATGC